MAASFLLDALIVMIPLLAVPLGLWRGAPREALVGGGILLAASVTNDIFGTRAIVPGESPPSLEVWHFGAYALALIAGATLGHVGGWGTQFVDPGPDSRLAGGLLAWFNGILFVTLGLTAYSDFVTQGTPGEMVGGTLLTKRVILHSEWIFLAIAIGVIGVVAASLALSRFAISTAATSHNAEREQYARGARSPFASWPSHANWRPVRLPNTPDSGKVEPALRTRGGQHSTQASNNSTASTNAEDMPQTLASMVPLDVRSETRESAPDRTWSRYEMRTDEQLDLWSSQAVQRHGAPVQGATISRWLRLGTGYPASPPRPEPPRTSEGSPGSAGERSTGSTNPQDDVADDPA